MSIGDRNRGGVRAYDRVPRVSRQAVERWSERVGGPSALAAVELQRFLRCGRRRPRPRHWTLAYAEPGTIFVYSAYQPGVCVLVRDGVVVTVLTRSLYRGEAA